MKKFSAIIILVSIPIAVFASIIGQINVEGNVRAPDHMILGISGLSIGSEYSDFLVSEAIKKLYKEDLFQDISIDSVHISPDSVKLNIRIVEYSTLDNLYLSGMRTIGESDLRLWLRHHSMDSLTQGNWVDAPYKGRTVTPRKLLLWKDYLLEIYRQKGFVGTYIEIEFSEPGINGEVDVFINISEGKKITISNIILYGVVSLHSSDILNSINNREWGFYGWNGWKNIFRFGLFRKGMFNQSIFESEDISSIELFYKNRGFPDAKVDSFIYTFNEDSTLLTIGVFIFEGERMFFGSSNFSGSEFFVEDNLKDYLAYSTGDEFSLEKINKTQHKVMQLYGDSGYIYARLNPVQTRRESIIDISWEIIEGPRVKIRLVEIYGNMRTRDKVIRRQVTILPGEYFSISKLRLTAQRIYNLGFFENIFPDIATVDSSGTEIAYADLLINVIEKRSGQIRGGATYSHNGGIGVYGQFSIPNLFGKGEMYNLQLDLNSKMWNVEVGYTEPWIFDTPWSVGGRIFATTYEMDYYKYRKIGGSISASRPLKYLGYFKFYSNYTLERVDVEIFDAENASDYVLDQEGVNYLSELSLTFLRDSRDKYFNTSRGSFFSLRTNIAGGFLQGDINFREHITEVRWYFPLHIKTVNSTIPTSAFMLKGKAGVISNVYSLEIGDIPIYRLYRLGGVGDWGVRGYDDFSIGPVDEGKVIGGSTALLFNAEYSMHFGDMANLLVFGDIGNAWRNPYSVDYENGLGDLYKGAGIGFRLNIPMMGVMGIDYAYGFSSKEWIPHIQFGMSF